MSYQFGTPDYYREFLKQTPYGVFKMGSSDLTPNIYTATMNELIYGEKKMPKQKVAVQTFARFTAGVKAAVKLSPVFAQFNTLLMSADSVYGGAYQLANTIQVYEFEDAMSNAVRQQDSAYEHFKVSSEPHEHIIKRRINGHDEMVAIITIPEENSNVTFKLFLPVEETENGWTITPA